MLPEWIKRFLPKKGGAIKDTHEIREKLTTDGMESRAVPFKGGVRAADDGRPVIFGYPHVYEREADLLWFVEKIERHAFQESIGRRAHFCFWCHDSSQTLGNTENSTLIVRSDELGVYLEAKPPDPAEAPYVQNALAQLRGGYVNHGSVGFFVTKEEDETWEVRDGRLRRDIHRAEFVEGSPVPMPAYTETLIGVRSFEYVRRHLGADLDQVKEREVALMEMELELLEIGGNTCHRLK